MPGSLILKVQRRIAGQHDPLRADVAQKDAARELQQLANLGPKSAALLAAAGIASFEHLAQIGAVAAYVKAKQSGANVSLNLLWALEGALTGVSWKLVAREHRTSLLLALEVYENSDRGQDL